MHGELFLLPDAPVDVAALAVLIQHAYADVKWRMQQHGS
jgi:hypothetical protein